MLGFAIHDRGARIQRIEVVLKEGFLLKGLGIGGFHFHHLTHSARVGGDGLRRDASHIAGNEFKARILVIRPGLVIEGHPAREIQMVIVVAEDGDVIAQPVNAIGEIGDFGLMRAPLSLSSDHNSVGRA